MKILRILGFRGVPGSVPVAVVGERLEADFQHLDATRQPPPKPEQLKPRRPVGTSIHCPHPPSIDHWIVREVFCTQSQRNHSPCSDRDGTRRPRQDDASGHTQKQSDCRSGVWRNHPAHRSLQRAGPSMRPRRHHFPRFVQHRPNHYRTFIITSAQSPPLRPRISTRELN